MPSQTNTAAAAAAASSRPATPASPAATSSSRIKKTAMASTSSIASATAPASPRSTATVKAGRLAGVKAAPGSRPGSPANSNNNNKHHPPLPLDRVAAAAASPHGASSCSSSIVSSHPSPVNARLTRSRSIPNLLEPILPRPPSFSSGLAPASVPLPTDVSDGTRDAGGSAKAARKAATQKRRKRSSMDERDPSMADDVSSILDPNGTDDNIHDETLDTLDLDVTLDNDVNAEASQSMLSVPPNKAPKRRVAPSAQEKDGFLSPKRRRSQSAGISSTPSSHRICVCVRLRPPGVDDVEAIWDVSPHTAAIKPTTAHPVIIKRGASTTDNYAFNFDTILTHPEPTKSLYSERLSPIVAACLDGYNGTIFSYGQTGSGKTHTMTGTDDEPGIIPLAVREIFSVVDNDDNRIWGIRVSYLEIYNETLKDLLADAPQVGDGGAPAQKSRNRKDLIINTSETNRVQVQDLHEIEVKTGAEVFSAFQLGEHSRSVAGTDWNDHSSRSHCVFTITITSTRNPRSETSGLAASTSSTPVATATNDDDSIIPSGPIQISQLHLIDLAGSERSASNKTRAREGSSINKSLLSLGNTIEALSKGEQPRWRDSKLTSLLKPSLSGNARIAIVCTISPSPVNGIESISTLKFAARAKKIQTHAQQGITYTDAFHAQLEQRDREIERLNAERESNRLLLVQADGQLGELNEERAKRIAMQEELDSLHRQLTDLKAQKVAPSPLQCAPDAPTTSTPGMKRRISEIAFSPARPPAFQVRANLRYVSMAASPSKTDSASQHGLQSRVDVLERELAAANQQKAEWTSAMRPIQNIHTVHLRLLSRFLPEDSKAEMLDDDFTFSDAPSAVPLIQQCSAAADKLLAAVDGRVRLLQQEHERALRQLQLENASTTAELEAVQNQAKLGMLHASDLEQQLAQLREQLEQNEVDARSRGQSQLEEVTLLRKELGSANTQLQAAKDKMAELSARRQLEREQESASMGTLQRENASLNHRVTLLQKDLEQMIEEKVATIARSNAEVEAIKVAHAAAANDISSAMVTKQQEAEAAQAELVTLRAQLATAHAENERQHSMCAQRDGEVSRLEKELSSARASFNDALEGSSKEAKAQRLALQAALKEHSNLRDTLLERDTALDALKAQLVSSVELGAATQDKLFDASKQLQDAVTGAKRTDALLKEVAKTLERERDSRSQEQAAAAQLACERDLQYKAAVAEVTAQLDKERSTAAAEAAQWAQQIASLQAEMARKDALRSRSAEIVKSNAIGNRVDMAAVSSGARQLSGREAVSPELCPRNDCKQLAERLASAQRQEDKLRQEGQTWAKHVAEQQSLIDRLLQGEGRESDVSCDCRRRNALPLTHQTPPQTRQPPRHPLSSRSLHQVQNAEVWRSASRPNTPIASQDKHGYSPVAACPKPLPTHSGMHTSTSGTRRSSAIAKDMVSLSQSQGVGDRISLLLTPSRRKP